jgi:hypothetical protein
VPVSNPCVRCGAPTDATVCRPEARALADELLVAAGHAEDAEAVITRQVRYSAGGRSGSDEQPIIGDLTASARLGPIDTAICGWARIVSEETGRRPRWKPAEGPLCPPLGRPCSHDSCAALRRSQPPSGVARDAAWLAQPRQMEFLRKHPAADEAFAVLEEACEQLAILVDRPAEKDLVGVCDCGKVLYAAREKAFVTCPQPTCRLVWNVDESRDILRRHLGDKLVTIGEAARLAAYLDSDRTQDNIRKLLESRVKGGQLLARGELHGEPIYQFREVSAVLAAIPRRQARHDAEPATRPC